ncbi:LL-diaminopimelate aminotransferase [Anaerostipes sp. 992a]|uniref:aminotransferase class I/II-fold pyridoxal phosphate-dependent enzyme n=1 Tax=Anaerostipes sp. 992a TaxID=1261637 RepID=UPI000950F4B4|nr:aminotransferase class I/II-fold pyridoxal phosphate-dependent enzyme [Anaerostipes sp. 992a]OLR63649.1 LL-diaminopimelate aminotransferase [Anaerostipes sp. 992a]
MKQAQWLSHFETGIFAALDQKRDEWIASGKKVYNLSIGTPDFQPAPHIMEAMTEACKKPENYVYALKDMNETLTAVKDYYKKRFGVEVTTDEITSVHGSQEGIGHIGMALTSPGDYAILPNPGYPIFEAGAYLGGAQLYFYPLKKENGFLPVFEEIPEEIARKTKFMILSYPYNPVCAVANDEVYEKAIAFAKKYDIIIIHDNAYSDIIYDGKKGKSFLSYEGAKEVGIEFFSLSKSFNVTGLRISFAVGNREIIDAIKLLRSQIDFGMPIPIQKAAVAALTGPLDMVKEQCAEYQARRDALCGGLRKIGWNVPDSQGTMFVWAPIPEKFHSSEEFCIRLMEETGVICTPGYAFGSLGEGYVRFALVMPPEKLREVVRIIDESGILK